MPGWALRQRNIFFLLFKSKHPLLAPSHPNRGKDIWNAVQHHVFGLAGWQTALGITSGELLQSVEHCTLQQLWKLAGQTTHAWGRGQDQWIQELFKKHHCQRCFSNKYVETLHLIFTLNFRLEMFFSIDLTPMWLLGIKLFKKTKVLL